MTIRCYFPAFWRMTLALAVVASATTLVVIGTTDAQASQPGASISRQSPYLIPLKARAFEPTPGFETAAIRDQAIAGHAGERAHFLIQFQSLPDSATRDAVAQRGFHILEYVGGQAYVVSAPVAQIGEIASIPGLRWAGPILTTDKLSDELRAGIVGPWAISDDGDLLVNVLVHHDVSMDEAEAIVEAFGGRVFDSVPEIHASAAVIAPGRELDLARQDQISFIAPVGLPLGPHNDGARAATGADVVQAAPYNLDGSNVTVLVYDVGIADTHIDFGARILSNDGSAAGDHSTHTTGTVAGNGVNSNGNDSAGNPNGGTAGQWAGMAPNVNVRSFGTTGSAADFYNGLGGDLALDFATAIGQGIDLATMSLGNNVYRFDPPPCGQLGDYSLTAMLVDSIVLGGAGQNLIYFESAGNERGTGPTGTAPCGQFGTIASPATAKNSIALGALNSNDNSLTGFTSLGPTDDGRTKPDLIGPGCQSNGDLGVTSTGFIDANDSGYLDPGETTDTYIVMCGTSMSTPAAAGVGALVLQQWFAGHGSTRPTPHTVKAILVHTATDLGNAGPDFSFGWGAVDAQGAVDLVTADETADHIHVRDVAIGETVYYTFNSDGVSDVHATLAWDDPLAGYLSNPTLVNDVDLRLTGPDGTVHTPFVLDPTNPSNPATTGDDSRNNVEMVEAPAAEGTFTVIVLGAGVALGPQQYTLVTPEPAVENRPPIADADGPYTTNEGIDAQVDASGSTDPDGDALTYEWDFDGDDQFDDATGATPTFDLVGQDGLYPIAVKVTDVHGAYDIDGSTVTVSNVAPSVALLSDSPNDENTTTTVTATVTDPGWLDVLTATISWGDGSATEPMTLTGSENIRPDAVYTFSATHIYGDNGVFTAQVCGYDDDTSTCTTIDLTIDNVNPTVEIDETDIVGGCGADAFIAHAGDDVAFTGHATDPGSDDLDLTWGWGDGTPDTTTTYLVNPPDPDPPQSPSIQPRDITDIQSHAFAGACLYEVTFSALDDDGGTDSDSTDVVIVGNAQLIRSAGYWYTQFRKPRFFTAEELMCYLDIVNHLSSLFSEAVDADSISDAKEVMDPAHSNGDIRVQLDRQLLALWLNFANGAIEYDTLVDTDFDGVPDTQLLDVLCAVEAARLNPATPDSVLENWKNIVEGVNLLNENLD